MESEPCAAPRIDHVLKTWPEAFSAVWEGRKRFEYRRADRAFTVGDVLQLREWNPVTECETGRVVETEVTYIVHGPLFGIPEGYCVMSIGRPQ